MDLKFADLPNGLQAAGKIPALGWLQIIAFVGTIEVYNLQSEPKQYAGDYEGYGAFGIPFAKGIADKEKKEKSLLAEINNGRLERVVRKCLFEANPPKAVDIQISLRPSCMHICTAHVCASPGEG